jgi:hypothetical protein
MDTSPVYMRISSDIKEKIGNLSKTSGKQQSEILGDLIDQGLKFGTLQNEFSQTQLQLSRQEETTVSLKTNIDKLSVDLRIAQEKLDIAERAKNHLLRILNTQVGRCDACNAPIDLSHFAYQQCPNGHSRNITLAADYQKAPGVGDALVAGLAIIGGITLAAELLGGNNR